MREIKNDKEIFNETLWSNTFMSQTINLLKLKSVIWSDTPVDLEREIIKHKYFAIRVENLSKIQDDPSLLLGYANQAARGLAQAMLKDVSSIIHDELNYAKNEYPIMIDDIFDILTKLESIVIFPKDKIRVRAAYDLDYLATSIVGDIEYIVGIRKQ